MKKIIVTLFTVFLLQPISFSAINRGWLAISIFEKLYGVGTDPYTHPAAHFATTYIDFQVPTDVRPYATLLSYLEYGDGIPVFPRDWTCFNSAGDVSKLEVIKYVLEAFGLGSSSPSGSLPYNDYNNSSDPYYDYVLEAYNLGILPSSGNFYLQSNASYSFATNFINDVASNFPFSLYNLYDLVHFFTPLNTTPFNMNQMKGIQHGVFSHYAKNSFNIPDIKMNLSFSHFYSNAMVEMHEGFYPIKPLSRGWSHTYNSYIIREDNVPIDGVDTDFYYVIWPDGSIHVFDEDDEEYITLGVYDELDEIGSDKIKITKKDQTKYYYEKLDNGRKIYYLYKILDSNGNATEIEYEHAEEADTRRIEWVEAPSGKKLEFEYRTNTDLIEEITDPINRNLEFDYSGVSGSWLYNYPVLRDFYDTKGNNTVYRYDVNNSYDIHLLKEVELPLGNKIKADYDENGKLEEYQINSEDEVYVDVDFDYQNGNFHSEVDHPIPGSNSLTQEYDFNENGLVTDYEDNNNDVSIQYPSSGINVLLPTHSSSNGIDIDYTYDNRGNITKIDKENGDVVEEFEYYSDNNLKKYTDAEGNETEYFYNSGENLIQIIDALGNSIYFTYDLDGQLETVTNQEGITTTYYYENDGVVDSIVRPEGIYQGFSYDGVNRLLRHNKSGLTSFNSYDDNDNILSSQNSMGYVTTYNYDDNDNLIEIINAKNISTHLIRDDQDRVEKEIFHNLETDYDYDDDGTLDDMTKPSGAFVNYQYDNDGRLDGTGTITDIDYNNKNLIESITTNAGTLELDYDNLNMIEEYTTVHGTLLEYSYDDNGNVWKLEYPTVGGNTFFVKYYYDAKNRIYKVRCNTNGNYHTVAEYTYRADDLLETVSYGNGIIGTYSYDNAGRKTGISYTRPTGGSSTEIIFSENVTLDNRNNITNETRFYRELEFLNYAYLHASSETYTFNENNHQTNMGSLPNDIDDDGNTEEKNYHYTNQGQTLVGTFEYEFDKDDHVTEISNPLMANSPFNFIYNGFGKQVTKTRNISGTSYTEFYTRDIYTGNVLFESNDMTNEVIYHIYGVTGLEMTIGHAGNNQYRIGDLRGSVVATIGDNPNNNFRFNHYDDFGSLLQKPLGGNTNPSPATPEPNEFLYLGKHGIVSEAGTGLYNMKARYYDPKIGRFLSEDPVWSTNLYPYSDNNPISKIDPSGEIPVETVLDVASVGVSATDLYLDPSWGNAGYLLWDVASIFVPYVPGSYVAKIAKASSKVDLSTIVTFGRNANSKYHAFRHVDELGMDKGMVKNLILDDITKRLNTTSLGNNTRFIEVDGKMLQYNIYKFDDGTYNVGRINEILK